MKWRDKSGQQELKKRGESAKLCFTTEIEKKAAVAKTGGDKKKAGSWRVKEGI